MIGVLPSVICQKRGLCLSWIDSAFWAFNVHLSPPAISDSISVNTCENSQIKAKRCAWAGLRLLAKYFYPALLASEAVYPENPDPTRRSLFTVKSVCRKWQHQEQKDFRRCRGDSALWQNVTMLYVLTSFMYYCMYACCEILYPFVPYGLLTGWLANWSWASQTFLLVADSTT